MKDPPQIDHKNLYTNILYTILVIKKDNFIRTIGAFILLIMRYKMVYRMLNPHHTSHQFGSILIGLKIGFYF